jgi:HlyD family secretion protein
MPAEQLQALQKEMMDRVMAQRQAQGGQPGQPGQPAGAPQAQGGQPGMGGAARPEGAGGQFAQRQFGQGGFNRQGGQGGQQRQIPRLFYMDKDGKMHMTMIRTGVSDTMYTEIVRSELKEGDTVLAGMMTATTAQGNQNRPGGPMMFMGGPPGRR